MSTTNTRNPHGVAEVKPIALRLLPEEREAAEKLSEELGCSKSMLARDAYLKGLPLVIAEAGGKLPKRASRKS
jgi:hypothetical protein